MFGWLIRKFFMNDDKNSIKEEKMIDANQPAFESNAKNIRKFEIAVYDEDLQDDGSVKYNQIAFKQPVIVEASSPKELNAKLSLYKECGQIAKIIREIDPPTIKPITTEIHKMDNVNNSNSKCNIVNDCNNIDNRNNIVALATTPSAYKSSSIKYYKVGDIEIKDDNGKLYQKQWVKLTDAESQNLRLINDKNNSLVNINGKHFEMKKWIQIENQANDMSINIEENLK